MRINAPSLALALLLAPGAAFAQASPGYDQPPPCRAEQDFSRKAEAIIAERRACELAGTSKALSHLDDKGHLEAADLVFSVFAPYGLVGENLMRIDAPASGSAAPLNAEIFAMTAAELWLKSPEHRRHILDPRYDQSGIGVAMVGGDAVATQVFHGPPRRAAR
jgi:hypothetical protein